jgi:hypothetical protein
MDTSQTCFYCDAPADTNLGDQQGCEGLWYDGCEAGYTELLRRQRAAMLG